MFKFLFDPESVSVSVLDWNYQLYFSLLSRLDYRQGWDKDFRDYVKNLDKNKPIILYGDLNVAHKEIG